MIIRLPSSLISSSVANAESVLIAFDVVMLERLAISSLDMLIESVIPSSSRPKLSLMKSIASAKRPRICF